MTLGLILFGDHQILVSEMDLCDLMVCGFGFGLGIHQTLVSEVDPVFVCWLFGIHQSYGF